MDVEGKKMSTGELPLYTPSNDAPSYATEPQGDEQRLEIAGSSAEAQIAVPVVSDSTIPTEPIPAKAEGVRIVLERRKQDGKNVAVYRQSDVVKGEVVVDNPQGVKAVSIKLEGRQAVVVQLEDTLHDRGTLFSLEHGLWQSKNGGACPAKLEFAIPFPATFQDGKRTNPLPPSFSGRWPGGPLIVGSVSYVVTVVVKKQQRFGWWDKDWTLSEPILYRPRSRPPLPTPESGPPFLSITKQIPEEWHHVTTSVPSQQEEVGAIDCHLFIPAGRTYAFDTEIPFQLQLRAPMNHLLAAQGAGSPGDHTRAIPPILDDAKIAEPGPSSSAKYPTARTPLSVLSTLPQKLTGKQTEPGQKTPWVRVYLQRRITSKIYGQNAWSTMNIGEAQLSSMSPPDGVDALVWEGRVLCHKKPHVIFSGFSTSRFEIKDFIVLHVKPEKPEISPWKEHKYCHPVHLVTDPYSG